MVNYFAPLDTRLLAPTVIYILQILCGLAVCLFALWRGQRDHRVIACLFLAAFAFDWSTQDLLSHQDYEIRSLWLEGLATPIIVWMAVRSGALWLIIEAALQLLCATTVFVHQYARDIIGTWAPWELHAIWNSTMLLVLFIATLMVARRAKAGTAARAA